VPDVGRGEHVGLLAAFDPLAQQAEAANSISTGVP
jgi:hypothetical protein